MQSFRTICPALLDVPAIRWGAWTASKRSRTTIESRPEPQPAASAAKPPSRITALAKAIDTGKTLRKQADEKRRRQPDDVQVVAVDPLDERRAEALDRIATRTLPPLFADDVKAELARRQCPKRDARHGVTQLLPRRRQQAEPGDDLVRLAGKLLQHRFGLRFVTRLAVDAAVEHDLGVHPEHRPIAGDSSHRARLALRMALDLRSRIRTGQLLVVSRDNRLEWNRQLLQDRAPLRRSRREQERRGGRRAHPRLRARQSSSSGQRLAQAAGTVSYYSWSTASSGANNSR